MASMRLPSLMTFFLIRYFINYRIPGKFAMCENLLRHRFQFNSQTSQYFEINIGS